MRYFVYLRVEGLYVRELARRGMASASAPLVVHDEGRVLDVCEAGAVRGVCPEMPLSQARSLLSGGSFVGYERDAFVEASARWLGKLVAFSDTIEPLSPHEAALDLSGHPHPHLVTGQVVQEVASVEPRVVTGAAKSVWLARLAADHRGDALGNPAAFLARLPVTALTPLDFGVREHLRTLGFATAGDVQRLPLDTLRRQFRSTALTVHAVAHGRHPEPVRPLYPPDSLGAYVPIEGGTDSELTLEAVLDRLSVEIGSRLSNEDRQTCDLRVRIEHEDGGESFERRFSKPIGDASALRTALGLLVGGRSHADVYGVRVVLPNLLRKRGHQASLLGDVADRERIAPIVERIQTAFGQAALRKASEIKIPRRVLFLRALSVATGWR